MLVLTRKVGERIFVGDRIVVSVERIDSNTVRIGVDAPQDVKVLRDDVRTVAATVVAIGPV